MGFFADIPMGSLFSKTNVIKNEDYHMMLTKQMLAVVRKLGFKGRAHLFFAAYQQKLAEYYDIWIKYGTEYYLVAHRTYHDPQKDNLISDYICRLPSYVSTNTSSYMLVQVPVSTTTLERILQLARDHRNNIMIYHSNSYYNTILPFADSSLCALLDSIEQQAEQSIQEVAPSEENEGVDNNASTTNVTAL